MEFSLNVFWRPYTTTLSCRVWRIAAQISILDFAIMNGYLPPKALALVVEWASNHKDELLENWQSLSEDGTGTFKKIEPLK